MKKQSQKILAVMKNAALLVVLLMTFAVPTHAADTLTQPDTDGCQTYMPYVWIELAPDEQWQTTVDMTQCAAGDLGLFTYYGYIAGNSWSRDILTRDGIELTVHDIVTGQSYAVTSNSNNASQRVFLTVIAPTQYLLTATNTSNRTKKVRMTWYGPIH